LGFNPSTQLENNIEINPSSRVTALIYRIPTLETTDQTEPPSVEKP
jgi:hypothetical protein